MAITFKSRVWNHNTNTYDETIKTVGVGTTAFSESKSERVMSDVWEWFTYVNYWDMEANRWAQVESSQIISCDYDIGERADKIIALAAAELENRLRPIEYRVVEDAASIPELGSMVRVTRGRSNKGAEGKVVVKKEMLYSMGYRSSLHFKLGIALDDETVDYVAPNGKVYKNYKNMVWAWVFNCEVQNPNPNYEAADNRVKNQVDSAINFWQQKIALWASSAKNKNMEIA